MERVGRVFLGSVLIFMAHGKGRVWLVFRAFDIEQNDSLIMCSIGEMCMLKKTGMCKEAVCMATGNHGGLFCKNQPRILWPFTLVKHPQIVGCQLSTVCAGINNISHKSMKADVFTVCSTGKTVIRVLATTDTWSFFAGLLTIQVTSSTLLTSSI